MAPHRCPRLWPLLFATLILAGCKDTRIVDYRVPKEPRPAPPSAGAGAATLRWQAPPGWQEQPTDGVRQGSFLVAGANGAKADLSVTSFPGDVGGDLANLNRWRGQVQLAPIGESELAQALAPVNGPAGEFLVADLVGESAGTEGSPRSRILGAIFKQPDRTWFFKLAGNADLVEAQKPAFLAFLQSVEVDPAGSPPVAAPERAANTNDLPPDARGALPPDHPRIDTGGAPAADMASTAVIVTPGQALVWTAPPEWAPKMGSPMRKGSYAVSGPEGAADLSITAFPGNVGGNLANVNRWRGQLGLPPVAALEGAVQPLTANGLQLLVFDGANQGNRILGAIVSRPAETWFFKLTGPDALVARTKPAFLDFLQTVKAP